MKAFRISRISATALPRAGRPTLPSWWSVRVARARQRVRTIISHTVINTLFRTELAPGTNYAQRHMTQLDKAVEVDVIRAELEEKQFRVNLTIVDTPGFGDYVNNRDCWVPLIDFIDDQHESYLRQEQQPDRSQLIDTRVHACLYFIAPTFKNRFFPSIAKANFD